MDPTTNQNPNPVPPDPNPIPVSGMGSSDPIANPAPIADPTQPVAPSQPVEIPTVDETVAPIEVTPSADITSTSVPSAQPDMNSPAEPVADIPDLTTPNSIDPAQPVQSVDSSTHSSDPAPNSFEDVSSLTSTHLSGVNQIEEAPEENINKDVSVPVVDPQPTVANQPPVVEPVQSNPVTPPIDPVQSAPTPNIDTQTPSMPSANPTINPVSPAADIPDPMTPPVQATPPVAPSMQDQTQPVVQPQDIATTPQNGLAGGLPDLQQSPTDPMSAGQANPIAPPQAPAVDNNQLPNLNNNMNNQQPLNNPPSEGPSVLNQTGNSMLGSVPGGLPPLDPTAVGGGVVAQKVNSSNKVKLLLFVLLIVLAVAIGVYYFLIAGNDNSTSQDNQSDTVLTADTQNTPQDITSDIFTQIDESIDDINVDEDFEDFDEELEFGL